MELVLAVVEAARGDDPGVAPGLALGDLLQALDRHPRGERPEPVDQPEPALLLPVLPGVCFEVPNGRLDLLSAAGEEERAGGQPGLAGHRRGLGAVLGQQHVSGGDRQGENHEEGEGCPVAEYR